MDQQSITKSEGKLDQSYMQRALELARLGQGRVSPNPLVGAVIVWKDKIIGEGWHEQYGQAHAEVNAVNNVADPALLSESTIYVNLEPCSHHGKTPPCADLLVKHKLKRVCIAHTDPNPLVAGNGIARLEAAGIEVKVGILEEEAQHLNRRFLRFMKDKRPYVIFKWAETADGFMARENFDSKWISNLLSRKIVHKWRAEEDAIMVGKNTARWDNPKLTVRDWSGENPVRIVIDRQLELSPSLNIFDQQTPTICYNLLKNEERPNIHLVKLSSANFAEEMMEDLYNRKIQSVIVEGGSFLLNHLFEKDLWDEARVFKSHFTFKSGIRAPVPSGRLMHVEKLLSNWYFEFQNHPH